MGRAAAGSATVSPELVVGILRSVVESSLRPISGRSDLSVPSLTLGLRVVESGGEGQDGRSKTGVIVTLLPCAALGGWRMTAMPGSRTKNITV